MSPSPLFRREVKASLEPSFDQIGPLTKSIEDAAIVVPMTLGSYAARGEASLLSMRDPSGPGHDIFRSKPRNYHLLGLRVRLNRRELPRGSASNSRVRMNEPAVSLRREVVKATEK